MQREYRTRCRECIMDYLLTHSETPFSAAALYENLSAQGYRFNLTTIYRNLERLTENGTLLRFRSGDSWVYQYSGPHGRCQEHLHIQCGKCGKMVHLEGPAMEHFSEALKQEFGFSLECGESTLHGLCRDCQGKQDK